MIELKAWKCQNGHVMGMVHKGSDRVVRLLLYREATHNPYSVNGKGESSIEVMAVVEGYVADVKCSICERVRTWVPGEEAIKRLLARMDVDY